jgi:hypothetical protein
VAHCSIRGSGLLQSDGRSFRVSTSGGHRRHWQLEGQKIKGTLLLHLLLGLASTALIWLVWWLHFRGRKPERTLPMYRLPLEMVAAGVVALTAHLGGFLSGVNPGV